MKHFWINVQKSEERRAFMQKQFNAIGLENYRVGAITPDDFDDCLVQQRPLSCKHSGCNSCEYEYACLCSHIKALRMCLDVANDDWFVILEDDVFLPFVIDYDKLIGSLPKDAELLQGLILYGATVKYLYDVKLKHNIKFVRWQYLLPSTGMYIISRKGAEKLVDMFYDKNVGKYDFSKSTCQNVADVLLYSSVNAYASCIPFAYPSIQMGSLIHEDHLNAHRLAIKDIKEVVYDIVEKKDFEYITKYIPESAYEL